MTTGKRYDFLLKQIKDRDSRVESLDTSAQKARGCGEGGRSRV